MLPGGCRQEALKAEGINEWRMTRVVRGDLRVVRLTASGLASHCRQGRERKGNHNHNVCCNDYIARSILQTRHVCFVDAGGWAWSPEDCKWRA